MSGRVCAVFAALVLSGSAAAALEPEGVAAAGGMQVGGVNVLLAKALPQIVRVGTVVRVRGRVAGAVPLTGAVAVLQGRVLGASGASWRALARARLRGASFSVVWHPSPAGLLMARVAIVAHGQPLGYTPPTQLAVGAAKVLCAPAVAPASIPAGDGWITGGRYIVGGPFPGIDNCDSTAYTVTVAGAGGAAVATVDVAGGQSYAVALAPGSYQLTSDFCHGTATVVAGRETKADTICAVP